MASSIHNPPSKYLCLGSNGFQKLLAQFRSLIELMIDFHVDESRSSLSRWSLEGLTSHSGGHDYPPCSPICGLFTI